MRINIYGEEITNRVEIVSTTAEDTGNMFLGVRFYLESPDKLHHSPEDDDTSAVTFWVKSPKSGTGPEDVNKMRHILSRAVQLLGDEMSNV